MRSKEVENAINNLKEDVKYADLRDTVDGDCTICYIEDLETVLNYISELEKKDKTYEIVEEKIDLEDAEKELTRKSLEKIKEYMEDMKKNHQYCSYAEQEAIRYLELYINDSIPKQLIRDKIKELDEDNCVECIEFNLEVIEILKELLGE